MVDELILKTFKDSHVDCNHIDEFINKLSNTNSDLLDIDTWKQNPNQYENVNWNHGTTDPNIMNQVLQQQNNKE